jgi:hypothetical protein
MSVKNIEAYDIFSADRLNNNLEFPINRDEKHTFFNERFVGEFFSVNDWSRDYIKQNYDIKDGVLEGYIDYEKFANDAIDGGNIQVFDSNHNTVFVFLYF